MSSIPTTRWSPSTTGNSLILCAARIATASLTAQLEATVRGAGVITSRIGQIEPLVSSRFQQPRQIAVGEQPCQDTPRVGQHDGAGAPSGSTCLHEDFTNRTAIICDSAVVETAHQFVDPGQLST